jgi:hypothetical protein
LYFSETVSLDPSFLGLFDFLCFLKELFTVILAGGDLGF